MQIDLNPMDAAAIGQFLERSRATYVAELVANGVTVVEADKTAIADQAAAFPEGRPAPGHLVFDVVVDGEVAGHLWLGPRSEGDDGHWWVWDVEIAEAWRGLGVGRAVIRIAEDEARNRGGHEIGLQVFADNTVARHLYESLGYQEASLRLRKAL